MQQQPLFSVLIANYNNGKYLQEAIDSVYAQTYTNWEIVLVDDCSTDNSKNLYQKYKGDTRIKIFYNEKNKGCGYTKHRCIELATGVLCGFLDADDVLLPYAIEKHVLAHITYDKVSLIFSRYYSCDERLNIQSESELLCIPSGESYLTNDNHNPCPFASFKKNYYDQTSGIDTTYKAAIDQDLYYKLEEVGDIYALDEITYKWRVVPNSVSRAGNLLTPFYYSLLSIYFACVRRNISHEKYVLRFIDKSGIFYGKRMGFKEGSNMVYNSHSYRLGHAILHPFSWIKRIFTFLF